MNKFIFALSILFVTSNAAISAELCNPTLTPEETELTQNLIKAFDSYDKETVFNLLERLPYSEFEKNTLPCNRYFGIRSIYNGWNDIKELISIKFFRYSPVGFNQCLEGDLISRVQSPIDIDLYRTTSLTDHYCSPSTGICDDPNYSDSRNKKDLKTLIASGEDTCRGNDREAILNFFEKNGFPGKKPLGYYAMMSGNEGKSSNESWAIYDKNLLKARVWSTGHNDEVVNISKSTNDTLDISFGTHGSVNIPINRHVVQTHFLTFEKYGFFYLVVNTNRYSMDDAVKDTNHYFKISLDGKSVKEITLPKTHDLTKGYQIYRIQGDTDKNEFVLTWLELPGESGFSVKNLDKDLNYVRVDFGHPKDGGYRAPRHSSYVVGPNSIIQMVQEYSTERKSYFADYSTGKELFSFQYEPYQDVYGTAYHVIGVFGNLVYYIIDTDNLKNHKLFIHDMYSGLESYVSDLPSDMVSERTIQFKTFSDNERLFFISTRGGIKGAFESKNTLWIFDKILRLRSRIDLINDSDANLIYRPVSDGVYIESWKSWSTFQWDKNSNSVREFRNFQKF